MKKQYFNKILIFISLVILALSVILNKNFGDLDELWNYNFARNISDGLVAYRDFNIIVTPLSAMIASIFIYFFGNELEKIKKENFCKASRRYIKKTFLSNIGRTNKYN